MHEAARLAAEGSKELLQHALRRIDEQLDQGPVVRGRHDPHVARSRAFVTWREDVTVLLKARHDTACCGVGDFQRRGLELVGLVAVGHDGPDHAPAEGGRIWRRHIARPREPRFVSAAETFDDFGPFTLPYLTLPYPTLGGCQPHCKWVYARQAVGWGRAIRPRARTRWTLTGRRNRPGTACAARAELNDYTLYRGFVLPRPVCALSGGPSPW